MKAESLRFGAALSAVALLLLGAPSPAAGAASAAASAAAENSGYVDAGFPETTIGAPGAPGKTMPMWISNFEGVNPTLAVDVSDLAGVADLTFPDYCDEPDAGIVRCAVLDQQDYAMPIGLRAADGAAVDDVGMLRWTTDADNDIERSGESAIIIGDGVDLVVERFDDQDGVPVGAFLELPLTARNVGNQPASRLQFEAYSSNVDFPRFENCGYAEPGGDVYAICEVEVEDGPVGPGESVTIEGWGLTPRTSALRDWVYIGLYPAEDEIAAPRAPMAKGTGGTLTARRTTAVSTLARDLDESDNSAEFWLNTDNTADVAVVGDTASGGVGDVVTVTPAIRNLGPGQLLNRTGDGAVRYDFLVPEGTEVVTAPDTCRTVPDNSHEELGEAGAPGAPHYRCDSEYVMSAGDTTRHTFKLQIKRVIPDATGRLQAGRIDGNPDLAYDPNRANNSAAVVVNPTTPPGGGGGGLPVTGLKIGAVAGGGAALLVVGGLAVLLTRRRKVVTSASPDDES